jgi:hypothetical protein
MAYVHNHINLDKKRDPDFMADEIILDVDVATAMVLESQKFDKKIAEAEAVVADLKKQKATYIFETNIQQLIAQKKARAPIKPA